MTLTGVSPATARQFDKIFAKRQSIFSLMFEGNQSCQFRFQSENDLLDTLENGEGTYWSLERDGEDNISGIVPKSIEDVITGLTQTQLVDTFYDFNERL